MFYKISKYLKFLPYNFYLFLSHALLNKKKKKKEKDYSNKNQYDLFCVIVFQMKKNIR